MNIHLLRKTAEKLIIDNTPTILTAVGVVGAVGSTVLAWRAGYKTREVLEENQHFISPLPKKEMASLVYKHHLPVAGVLATTVVSTVLANRVSVSRAAALGAAYALTNEKFGEYRDKVEEKLGRKKEGAIHTEIAQDKVNANPVPQSIIISNDGKVPCLDLWSMTYFQADMESIRKAANDINIEIMNNQYASLSDFYDKIGITPGRMSDELGWNQDCMLELSFNSVLDGSTPVLTMDFEHVPIRGYGKCY